MNGYTEERPEAIEAIKSSIRDKWLPIKNLLLFEETWQPGCPLCDYIANEYDTVKSDCAGCPIVEAGMASCFLSSSVYQQGDDDEVSREMIKLLVSLLPEKHRAEFGG